MLGIGLLALAVIVILFIIGIVILAFILRAIIHWIPAVIVAILVYFFLHSLLYAEAAFDVIALLMVALRHR